MSIVGRNVQHYVSVNLLEASSETQKIRYIQIYSRLIKLQLHFFLSQGTRLHVFIENDLFRNIKHLLSEGQALSINAFSLKNVVASSVPVRFLTNWLS
ncbi:unnamed protein product [Brassica oleracea]|uniref:Uncharacterized protein n=1 Tax=Brassica oleracea TaxID=3712 RepID=A0A3P6C9R0_BRAOL|nr:unnamed protein product [Brassica oleracea]